MSVRICVCSDAESLHVEGVGCVALARTGDDVRCPCRSFVLAGSQLELPGEEMW